jgi:SNF2 family DNA or RNA helicase
MYQYREAPLTTQQLRYYRTLKTEELIKAADEQITAVNAAAKLSKLLQLSGGAVYTDDGEVLEFDVSPRFNALEETIDEAAHKVIIFVPFKHTIRLVKEFLDKKKITSEVISG